MTNELKFCKDCKHYLPVTSIASPWGSLGAFPEACVHPSNISRPDLVSGRTHPISTPRDLRLAIGNCGEDGLMFEAKPPKPAPVVWSDAGKYAGTYGGAVPDEEIRKPGRGHPIMLMAYAVVSLFVGLLAWAIFW